MFDTRKPRRSLAWIGLCLVSSPAFAAANAAGEDSSTIVVTATPLAAGTDGQIATAAEIAASHVLSFTDYLNRSMGSVYVNDIQNNPLQPDINYRGYTASPLLGTPQGLSIYLDGVRVNQPFGDVVSWDLIPRDAIASMALIPGSDPLFGRNTLGGALSIRTKDGRSDPGTAVEANYGSHQRYRVEAETGGSAANGLNWFLTANHFGEHGWREFSKSKASQAFGRLGWSDAKTDVALTGSFADTNLNGNGLQEQRLLANDYDSVYTQPDNTKNRSFAITALLKHDVSDTVKLSANAHYRHIRTNTFNGDLNDDSLGESVYQPNAAERAALTAAGYTGFPTSGESAANTPFPKYRCVANALLNSEPNEKCDGLLNRSRTAQHDAGVSAELTVTAPLLSLPNELVLGGAWESDRAHFTQSSQFGYLTADRGVVGVTGPGAFADGTQDSENAFDARVDLTGRTQSWGLFATDTLTLAEKLRLTLSGRVDRTTIHNRDGLTPGGGAGSLDGDDRYQRFNPAARIEWSPSNLVTAYAGYSEGSRAPSAIEIGCADPANPCRLPNALAGDPPLRQVVTHTIEGGLRGRLIGGAIAWNVGAFRADNHRDILFVADDQSGFGYFRNFGKTRRQGIEVGLEGGTKTLHLSAHYTYLDATYRSTETVNASGNSSNDGPAPGFDGNIIITPGDRIPLIPRNIFKVAASYDITPAFSVNADLVAQTGMIARGNENGQHQPDGVYYLGEGRSPGYAVVNMGAEWRPTRGLKFFAQVDNVTDRRYYTGAQLGATGFNANGSAFIARPFTGPVIDGERPQVSSTFYAPGAPRTFWLGARLSFGTHG